MKIKPDSGAKRYPYSNTGTNFSAVDGRKIDDDIRFKVNDFSVKILDLEKEGLKAVPVQKPKHGEIVMIDWLRFSFKEFTFFKGGEKPEESDFLNDLSLLCFDLFGFGITKQREFPLNGFEKTYILGDGLGMLSFGGSWMRGSILIDISGAGCSGSKQGWEQRVFNFMTDKKTIGPRLNRVDLAFDDFEGCKISVDQFLKFHKEGLFKHTRMPSCQMLGDWIHPNGKGRTFTVGTRGQSRCFLRCYEKGKQLGDRSSSWARVEIEFIFKSGQETDFSILINPSSHFLGAYRFFPDFFDDARPVCRSKSIQKTVEIGIEKTKNWIRKMYGKAIFCLRGLAENDTQMLDEIQREVEHFDQMPAAFRVPDFETCSVPLHLQNRNEASKTEKLPIMPEDFGKRGYSDAFCCDTVRIASPLCFG